MAGGGLVGLVVLATLLHPALAASSSSSIDVAATGQLLDGRPHHPSAHAVDDGHPMPTDDATVWAVQDQVFKEIHQYQQEHPHEQRPYYPACPYFDKLMAAFWGCPFLRASKGLLQSSSLNLTTIMTNKQAANPTGEWPQVLTDLRPDPPFEIPKALVAHERGTYYWMFRQINNLYHYASREEDVGTASLPLPPVPPGWGEQKLHWVSEKEDNVRWFFESFIDTPMAMTMWHEARQTLVVVIRGTMSPQEWGYDFKYQFAEGEALQDFPGRVHQGVYYAYKYFAASVLAEVARLNPSHVFVTGHSLGGALTHLLSYSIATQHPQARVDGVAFASIMMGDDCFMKAIRAKINLRNIFYLGTGQDGHLYRGGDMIPQATCGAFHGCPLLHTGDRSARYQYSMLGSYVSFYSEDMPNTEYWKYEENLMPYVTFRQYVSSHICSYVCWLSHGHDSETMCYFPRQAVLNPGKYRDDEICFIYDPLSQQVL